MACVDGAQPVERLPSVTGFCSQYCINWVWWIPPVIPRLGRWSQIDQKFRAILAYIPSIRSA